MQITMSSGHNTQTILA